MYLSFCNREMFLQNIGPLSQSSLMPSFIKAIWRGGGDPFQSLRCMSSDGEDWSKKMEWATAAHCRLLDHGEAPGTTCKELQDLRGPKGHPHLHRTASGDLELNSSMGQCLHKRPTWAIVPYSKQTWIRWPFPPRDVDWSGQKNAPIWQVVWPDEKDIHKSLGCFLSCCFFLRKIQHLPQLIHTSSTKSKRELRLETKTKQLFCFGSNFILFYYCFFFSVSVFSGRGSSVYLPLLTQPKIPFDFAGWAAEHRTGLFAQLRAPPLRTRPSCWRT